MAFIEEKILAQRVCSLKHRPAGANGAVTIGYATFLVLNKHNKSYKQKDI